MHLSATATVAGPGPGAVLFGDNELQPHVQVIPGPPSAASWFEVPGPLLVVEVLSDSTRLRDFGIELEAYLTRVEILQAWLVDWERREIIMCETNVPVGAEQGQVEWMAPGARAAGDRWASAVSRGDLRVSDSS